MQHGTFSRFKRCSSIIILATLACAGAPAAELGELTVRSFIGQPLVADIELTALAPDELSNLHVRLASPDVFQGANISMNPVLQSLNMTLMRRDQRQFLHITSFKPVNTEYLHLFVEISGGGRSTVRSATLWLTPDLTPAPLPAPAVKIAPQPEPRPAPAPRPAPEPALEIAPPAPARPVAGRVTPIRIRPGVLAREARSGPAGACVSEDLSRQATQCIALEHKNEALTKKLIELEGKVKMLQEGFAPAPASALASESASAHASRPAALTPLKFKPVKALPSQIKAAEPEPVIARPRTLLAGGTVLLLLLIGLAVHLFQRRKLAKTVVAITPPAAEPSEAEESEEAVNEIETVAAVNKPSLLRRLFGRKKAASPGAKPADDPAIEE